MQHLPESSPCLLPLPPSNPFHTLKQEPCFQDTDLAKSISCFKLFCVPPLPWKPGPQDAPRRPVPAPTTASVPHHAPVRWDILRFSPPAKPSLATAVPSALSTASPSLVFLAHPHSSGINPDSPFLKEPSSARQDFIMCPPGGSQTGPPLPDDST